MSGRLIVFEGPDGVGKSRLATEIGSHLESRGIETLQVSFPGNNDNTLGQLVYNIHHYHQEQFRIPTVNPLSLQMLHIAAHIDQIDSVIRPAVVSGKWIILSRFWWSTWVYGKLAGIDDNYLELITDIEKRYWGRISPAAIFLIKRTKPLRHEKSPEIFERLSDFYCELAGRERALHVVHDVENIEVFASLEIIKKALQDAIS